MCQQMMRMERMMMKMHMISSELFKRIDVCMDGWIDEIQIIIAILLVW